MILESEMETHLQIQIGKRRFKFALRGLASPTFNFPPHDGRLLSAFGDCLELGRNLPAEIEFIRRDRRKEPNTTAMDLPAFGAIRVVRVSFGDSTSI